MQGCCDRRVGRGLPQSLLQLECALRTDLPLECARGARQHVEHQVERVALSAYLEVVACAIVREHQRVHWYVLHAALAVVDPRYA